MKRSAEIDALRRDLASLRDEMLSLEREVFSPPNATHRDFVESARNLVHYLSLRRRDLRELQTSLADLGLSSLGRAESHVLSNVEAVIEMLLDTSAEAVPSDSHCTPITRHQGNALLQTHTYQLLGAPPARRRVRIMVTLPTEAATDRGLVRQLVDAGMDCVRINCAHDGPEEWSRMIANLRAVELETGGSRPIAMDLAGPKLRTGHVEPGPEVLKIKPERDASGHVVNAARVLLRSEDNVPEPPFALTLPVDGSWIRLLGVGDTIQLDDARGAKREMSVVECSDAGVWVESAKTAYIESGTVIRHKESATKVGRLAQAEGVLILERGEILTLVRDPVAGRNAERNSDGQVVRPATISCTLPGVFVNVRPGHRIFFDDGRIGGVVRQTLPGRLDVEITEARPGGEQLRGDKGINLPDTNLNLPALTAKDLEDLDFVAAHADIVNYSFAHETSDVEALDRQLAERGAAHLGVVLKIETRRAFENLPNLLLAAMRAPRRGVMIARGDLAVECGFERMAEVQEEILWLCEAAHVPVIWATQVLESLAKKGAPSRAEITDAAMSNRAECVMLNKGPHIVLAVAALDDILCRMSDHQSKKSPTLRQLSVAGRTHG